MSREVYKHNITKKECLFVVRNFTGEILLWNVDVPEKETYVSIRTRAMHPLDGDVKYTLFTDKSNCDTDFCLEVEEIAKASDEWSVRRNYSS